MYGDNLHFVANAFLEQQGRLPRPPYHLILLHKSNIINENWLLSGRDTINMSTYR